MTASFVEWSACLTTNQEVASSIPGTSTSLKVEQIWKGARYDNWVFTRLKSSASD